MLAVRLLLFDWVTPFSMLAPALADDTALMPIPPVEL